MRGAWMLLFVACGPAAEPPPAEPPPEESSGAEEPPRAAAWLAELPQDHVLSYDVVLGAAEPRPVHMLVQQRIERGESVAVQLAPIGTPLGETPVYLQWWIGTPDGLLSLEEHAAFTEPGFVPIDAEGRLVTEAASSEAWHVDPDWLRADRLASGSEAAVGWTLLERVPSIDAPIHASRCVRLERTEGSARTVLLVCADTGVVELTRSEGERTLEAWRLTSIGPRPVELQ